jgi:hypothetical protein
MPASLDRRLLAALPPLPACGGGATNRSLLFGALASDAAVQLRPDPMYGSIAVNGSLAFGALESDPAGQLRPLPMSRGGAANRLLLVGVHAPDQAPELLHSEFERFFTAEAAVASSIVARMTACLFLAEFARAAASASRRRISCVSASDERAKREREGEIERYEKQSQSDARFATKQN